MTPKSPPGTGRKKPQIRHRDGALQEPALVIEDEVFGRHNKDSDAKTLKTSAMSSNGGRTSKTSIRTVIPTTFSLRPAPPPTCAVTTPDSRPLQGEAVRMRRVPRSAHMIFTLNDNGLIDHHR